MHEIAPDVAVVPMIIVNAYLVGDAQSWVLVDSGIHGKAEAIRKAAEDRFGVGARPNAIILTHGHFDHSGSAKALANRWNVKVYAHRLEFPYLTGRSSYPPVDPTAPGFFAALSRLFPAKTADIRPLLSEIDPAVPFPGLTGWECIPSPGHTPGHVSFYRARDGVLLAGDALATVNMDNFFALVTQRPVVYRPPTPATTDWMQARSSVDQLARLRPSVIGAGHGKPMADAGDQLAALARDFPIPEHGRYVREPARADENGITYLPPAPPDRTPKIASAIGVTAVLVGLGIWFLRRSRQQDLRVR